MLIALFTRAAFAGCPESPLADAIAAGNELELAFTNLDDAAFDAAAFRLDNAIPCISDPIAVPDAIAIHRAKGLSSFVLGKPDDSRAAWGAIRELQPDAKAPQGIMPAGHPLLRLWNESEGLVGTTRRLDRKPAGGWRVDGLNTSEVPALHAYVLQGFDAAGNVVYTGWYPAYAPEPELPEMEAVSASTSPEKHGKRWVAMGIGGGLLVASGITAIGAESTAGNRDQIENAEVPGAAARYRALGGASVGLAALGATTLTVGLVMPW